MRSGGVKALDGFMPDSAIAAMNNAVSNGLAPFDSDKFEAMMLGVLRRMSTAELLRLPDISEGIENRIHAAIRQACTVEEVYSFAKSKRYTAARIRRVIMSAFLGLDDSLGKLPPPYIRVLGFNARGREVLAEMKRTARLPVSDSIAFLSKVNSRCAEMVEMESRATDLYMLGMPNIRPCGFDFTAESIRDL